ncbi:GNAT family N-acetyltransferase [uncultured Microscilla sp.]|uniref:GNAT family N-acetyltransferase n=1 Tax=uncultured Microscilla sp. TaxID=432653 RepID=UPI00262D12C9|nr:GNAT family N-acetyltransferase [uncultured Microscilla sp.]
MRYTIKKLTQADITLAKQLIEAWHTDDGATQVIYPREKYLAKLLTKKSFHAYVAMVGNKVVGGLTAYEMEMFDTEETEMFLFEIGVNKEARQKGIATALIEALKQTCYQQHIAIIFVGTSMDNEAAKKLYAKTGGSLEITPFYTYELK